MNEVAQHLTAASTKAREAPHERLPDNPAVEPTPPPVEAKRGGGARILGLAVVLLLCWALALGFWQHYRLHAQVMTTAEQLRDFVPTVRAAPVRPSASTMSVNWPGTTEDR